MKTSTTVQTPSVIFNALAVMGNRAAAPTALETAHRLAKALAVAASDRRNAATAVATAQRRVDAADEAHAAAVAAWDKAFN